MHAYAKHENTTVVLQVFTRLPKIEGNCVASVAGEDLRFAPIRVQKINHAVSNSDGLFLSADLKILSSAPLVLFHPVEMRRCISVPLKPPSNPDSPVHSGLVSQIQRIEKNAEQ